MKPESLISADEIKALDIVDVYQVFAGKFVIFGPGHAKYLSDCGVEVKLRSVVIEGEPLKLGFVPLDYRYTIAQNPTKLETFRNAVQLEMNSLKQVLCVFPESGARRLELFEKSARNFLSQF